MTGIVLLRLVFYVIPFYFHNYPGVFYTFPFFLPIRIFFQCLGMAQGLRVRFRETFLS